MESLCGARGLLRFVLLVISGGGRRELITRKSLLGEHYRRILRSRGGVAAAGNFNMDWIHQCTSALSTVDNYPVIITKYYGFIGLQTAVLGIDVVDHFN